MIIKIVSNPYTREIDFFSYKEQFQQWENIKDRNGNSKLRESISNWSFLPFRIKEIIDTIISEYYINGRKIQILFEGTQDEYNEVKSICNEDGICDKIELSQTERSLGNARIILEPTKEIFEKVRPVIEKIIEDDNNIKNLNKVADALKDIVPICVFGNYSAGKSTFINALIGSEILPSGSDPVTAKIYKIERSKYPDTATIKFFLKNKEFEILFEGTDCRLKAGDPKSELIKNIFSAIGECDEKNMSSFIRIALELINGYEKKEKNNIAVSNVIELEVPFSKSGILGQSYNNFVIFDTPGSNSKSNADHSTILTEALEGFSNGIPVWVSTYESIDSTDNATLCDKILSIKALDKRFTMIVLNKADGSDLGEKSFSAEKEQEILEYSSVEKMYSGGIYFVSSIMGLGAKNGGELSNKHYRSIYRSQQKMYADPNNEDHTALYKYNIMPYLLKKDVASYSSDCSNKIYSNSGLYCIEREIENFASKYSAYNKCQMAYLFLKEVIEETDKRIVSKTNFLKYNREKRKDELEKAKAYLINKLNKTADDQEIKFYEKSKEIVKNLISNDSDYHYKAEHFETIEKQIHDKNLEKHNFSSREQEYETSKSKILSNMRKNFGHIFKGEGTLGERIQKTKDDYIRDVNKSKEIKEEKHILERKIDRSTSDELLKSVKKEFRENFHSAKEHIDISIKKYWSGNELILKDKLIKIVKCSDALSYEQREEISGIITDYDSAENIFNKRKFLKKNIFEKINIKKLAQCYNEQITKVISEYTAKFNENTYNGFKAWKEGLEAIIEQNIAYYNPKLKDISDMIREETEKITELENDQSKIAAALNDLEEDISWQTIE